MSSPPHPTGLPFPATGRTAATAPAAGRSRRTDRTADPWPARLRRRGPPGRLGWRRALLLRRAAAVLLAGLALLLAVLPPERAALVPVVVAAVDLPAGSPLRADDLAVRDWPAELAPGGSTGDVAAVDGRSLVGAARAGEPITDARLVGGTPVSHPGGAVVAVRLADAGVAAVLSPGSRVDVVTTGERAIEPVVLTSDATVQAVLAPESAGGPLGSAAAGDRLVLLAMSRDAAERVAAVSLNHPVAVTLR